MKAVQFDTFGAAQSVREWRVEDANPRGHWAVSPRVVLLRQANR